MNSNSASAMMRFLSSEGWKEKSKLASVLMVESRAMTRAVLMRRFSRSVEFLREQRVDCLDGGHLALLDPAHRGIEDLDCARHLEADQGLLDAVDEGGDDLCVSVHRAPPFASLRAMAS